jgi:TPR repeat protein
VDVVKELLTQEIVWNGTFSEDGGRIATASSNDLAQVWKIGSDQPEATVAIKDVINSKFNRDGSRVLSASVGYGEAALWEANSGKIIKRWGANDSISTANFNREGDKIVVGSPSGSVRVFSAINGDLIMTLRDAGDWVHMVGFSPDGSRIVAGLADNTARVWDTRNGKEKLVLRGHTKNVHTAAYTDDGSRIVTSSVYENARIWDANTGAELRTLSVAPNELKHLSISPKGTQIAIVSDDNNISLWKIPMEGSEIWFPALRARTVRAINDDDRRSFFLDTFDEGPVANACDEFAGDPFDPNRLTGGVLGAIETAPAIAACSAALKAHPDESRFAYELGRMLAASGQYKDADEAYNKAVAGGYPAALYGLAQLARVGGHGIQKNPQRARELFEKAFNLGVAIAGTSFADMLLEQNGGPDARVRAIWRRAADLGDPTAHLRLGFDAVRSSPSEMSNLEIALEHYAIGARLLENVRGDGTALTIAQSLRATIAHALPIEIVARIWYIAIDEGDQLLRKAERSH